MVGTRCCASAIVSPRMRSTASLPDYVYEQPNIFTAPLKQRRFSGSYESSFNRCLVSFFLLAIMNGALRDAVLTPRLGEHESHVIGTITLCTAILTLLG